MNSYPPPVALSLRIVRVGTDMSDMGRSSPSAPSVRQDLHMYASGEDRLAPFAVNASARKKKHTHHHEWVREHFENLTQLPCVV